MGRGTRNSGWSVHIGMALILAAALPTLSAPAQAALITRDVSVTLDADVNSFAPFDLDVDLDGTIDFTFTAVFAPDPVLTVGFDVVDFPFASNNGVVIEPPSNNGFPTASLLGAGDTVSDADAFSLASFDQGNLFFFISGEAPSGNFAGRTGFLGLRFDRSGGSVFGFAQITVNDLNAPINPLGLTIGTVGFDDVPGQAVQITAVPEPTSLILLGFGAIGLLSTARRRTA